MTDREIRPCYRDVNGVRFTKGEHAPDCGDSDCRGCRKCPAPRHCTARSNCAWHVEHGELTCGRCLAGVRTDLRWIAALAPLLPVAAVGDGVDSEAANLAGPAADPEAWSWRKVAAKQGRAWHVSLVEDDDEHHPATVLGTWERMIREDYDHETTAPLSVAGAADYLDRVLHRIAHDDEQDFPLMRRELRKCRQHLEAVLHNDDRPDRGAPCPDCTSEQTGVGPRLVRKYGHWCEDDDCQRLHYDDEADDVWQCPKVRAHRWTHKAYSDYVEERRATA